MLVRPARVVELEIAMSHAVGVAVVHSREKLEKGASHLGLGQNCAGFDALHHWRVWWRDSGEMWRSECREVRAEHEEASIVMGREKVMWCKAQWIAHKWAQWTYRCL